MPKPKFKLSLPRVQLGRHKPAALPAPEKTRCPQCGRENSPEASYCQYCGASLAQAQDSSASAFPPSPDSSTEEPGDDLGTTS